MYGIFQWSSFIGALDWKQFLCELFSNLTGLRIHYFLLLYILYFRLSLNQTLLTFGGLSDFRSDVISLRILILHNMSTWQIHKTSTYLEYKIWMLALIDLIFHVVVNDYVCTCVNLDQDTCWWAWLIGCQD